MDADEPGASVTRWIGDLKAGDDRATQALWQRDSETDLAGEDAGVDVLAQAPPGSRAPSSPRRWPSSTSTLLDRLGDDTLRQVAIGKMEGDSSEEIAARLGGGLRTVDRKLGVIWSTWLADEPA